MDSMLKALIWLSFVFFAVIVTIGTLLACVWFHRFPTEVETYRLAITILGAIVIDKWLRD